MKPVAMPEMYHFCLYRAIANMTAPPTIAATSRARPAVVKAAAPVCRPGVAEVAVVDESVGWTCTTLVEVIVLRVPSGMVVVLL